MNATNLFTVQFVALLIILIIVEATFFGATEAAKMRTLQLKQWLTIAFGAVLSMFVIYITWFLLKSIIVFPTSIMVTIPMAVYGIKLFNLIKIRTQYWRSKNWSNSTKTN